MAQDWFKNWFNSPYYHMLYNERDEAEADRVVKNLIKYINPAKGSYMLDLACGKGRHAQVLNQLGYVVTGLDIAPESITEAVKTENEQLSFYVHDMRAPFGAGMYDYVFNFFTSFGYFNNIQENEKVLLNINKALRPKGTLVIDFFNSELVECAPVTIDEKEKCGILFKWFKRKEDGKVLKTITFSDKGQSYEFTERVQLISLNDFERILGNAGFEIVCTFGDYDLNVFDSKTSPRLIIIAKKKD